MPLKSLALLFLLIICSSSHAQRSIKLSSPDKNLLYTFSIQKNIPTYTVSYNKQPIITPSAIKFKFGNATLGNPSLRKTSFRDTTESYSLVIGKTSNVTTSYREASIPISFGSVSCTLTVRAFNDAIAWRYTFDGPKGDSLVLNDEHTEFNLAGNPSAKTLFLPSFTSSHEGLYSTQPYQSLPDSLMDMPALFSFPNNNYLAITEAALLDYAGTYLKKENNTLHGVLSPLPKRPGTAVVASYPHKSPWRVLLISNRVGALIESTVLTTLCPPSVIGDASWLKPGTTTFPWWNGNVVADTINAPGNNFVTQKYYIDFCARNHITYHSVVEYGLHQWYVDDGPPFSPGPHSDVTRTVNTLDMKEVCDYAATKNVGIRVWVHWAALYPKLDTAFKVFEAWGLKGMMCDFMDRDDQEMVNIQTEILQKAAQHHLHIQFHGAYKNTGLSRTYPNEFTREGTLNYENNKWNDIITADHDLNILYTRALAGSTDYHLGGFRFVNDTAYRAQYTRPLIRSTRCHMLGMYVVMENALGMVCDYPAAYEGQPGFEFISRVPTVWDETKVIAGKPDEFLVIARRKNKNWYLGAVGNHAPHDVNIPLDFLKEGTYTAEMFTDNDRTAADPNMLSVSKKEVNAKSSIPLHINPNGGAAMIFSLQGAD